MSDRLRLSLDLLYVAIENLLINIDDGDGLESELDDLLVPTCELKDRRFVAWLADDLQSDWKPAAVEPARYADGRQAIVIREHRQLR